MHARSGASEIAAIPLNRGSQVNSSWGIQVDVIFFPFSPDGLTSPPSCILTLAEPALVAASESVAADDAAATTADAGAPCVFLRRVSFSFAF